jgi:hypothetical protein
MTAGRLVAALAAAGLFAGAAAWALHQQAGYILAGGLCRGTGPSVLVLDVAVAAILAVGAWVSWMALRRRPGPARDGPEAIRPRQFMATVALMGAALFGFAIALQIAAWLFLAPCVT